MKRKTMLMSALAVLVMGGIFLGSCTKEEALPTPEKGTMSLKAAIAYEDCETQCIEPGSGDYFFKTDQEIVSWGGPNNDKFSKTVDIEYYNTETHFVLKVRSTKGWSDLVIDDVPSWTDGPVGDNEWGTYSVELGQDWQACDDYNFVLQVAGNGPSAIFDVAYKLIGLCGCELGMTGATTCDEDGDRTATFTFTTEEAGSFKIQGGLTNFTSELYSVTTSIGTYESWIPGGSSNRIISVTGDILDCETVTIVVSWNSTNSDEYITGDWSVELNGVKLLIVDMMTCDDSKVGHPPVL